MNEERLLELFRRVVREELQATTAETVDIDEAARRLSVSEPTVRRMIRRGELLAVTISKTPKVPVTEIRRLATPSASMPTYSQRPIGGKALAKFKARSLARRHPRSMEAEIAKLRAGRAAAKKR